MERGSEDHPLKAIYLELLYRLGERVKEKKQ